MTRFCARPYLLCGIWVTTLGTGAGGHGRAERAFHTTLGERNFEIKPYSSTPRTRLAKGKGLALRAVSKGPIVHIFICRARRHAVCRVWRAGCTPAFANSKNRNSWLQWRCALLLNIAGGGLGSHACEVLLNTFAPFFAFFCRLQTSHALCWANSRWSGDAILLSPSVPSFADGNAGIRPQCSSRLRVTSDGQEDQSQVSQQRQRGANAASIEHRLRTPERFA